eukprot:2340893-Prymnesium_polylepis.1
MGCHVPAAASAWRTARVSSATFTLAEDIAHSPQSMSLASFDTPHISTAGWCAACVMIGLAASG